MREKHKVRTKMRPDVEIEVDDIEFLDMKRQGLIAEVPEKRIPEKPAPRAVEAKKES